VLGSGSARANQRASLKSAVQLLKTIQRFQELKAGIAHLITGSGELVHVLDREPDAFDHYTYLVRHLDSNGDGRE
jgi:hypothetical protein